MHDTTRRSWLGSVVGAMAAACGLAQQRETPSKVGYSKTFDFARCLAGGVPDDFSEIPPLGECWQITQCPGRSTSAKRVFNV